MKKRTIYIVIDNEYPQYQDVYGSKTRLLESFYECVTEEYMQNLEYDMSGTCSKCENRIKKLYEKRKHRFSHANDYDFSYCIDCKLFYCTDCVGCIKCDNKILNYEELIRLRQDNIKDNFLKEGLSSLENYFFDCEVREEQIEFSDDEDESNS